MSSEAAAFPPDLQHDVDRLPEDLWDAVVVGAGPAGAVAALHLARRGHRVLLVDRARFPRDKACGDLLIPDSLGALRRAGLHEAVAARGRTLSEAVVSSPSRIEWRVAGEFLTLRRRVLDAIVVEGAAKAGAVLARGTAEQVAVDPGGDGASVRFRGGARARGRVALLATGADVSLAEGAGLVERKAPTAVAVRAYIRAPVGPARLVIAFDRSIVPGYGWLFPLPEGEFNVGVGVLFEERSERRRDLRTLLERFLERYPPAREIVGEGGGVEEFRGARLRCGLEGTRLAGGGPVLAIGETVGTTYPFTGEGVGKAMESGELAAAAVHEALSAGDPARLSTYDRAVGELLRPRYRGYRAAQTWFSRPLLNDLVSWRVRRSPYLQRKAAEMVAERSDPREAVSLRGLARSLWS